MFSVCSCHLTLKQSRTGSEYDANSDAGFLRRINKLLFHGIKPVFVFDGGAPNLKRATIVCVPRDCEILLNNV